MPRRSTRKPVVVPEGWTEHDGSGLPVHPHSRPALLFRIGTKTRMGGRPAGEYQDYAQDPWTWDRPGAMDIIAYLDEPDEYVRIEKLR